MRLLIVSDAWEPQVSGVVRTLRMVRDQVRAQGYVADIVGPDRFRTVPCPTYPQIPLAVLPRRRLAALIDDFSPDSVHVATEGPLGWAARRICRRRRWPFTTSYHTQFPDYVRMRFGVPLGWSFSMLRRFHGAAARTMVATPTLARQLRDRGFGDLVIWSRGVDVELFRPRDDRVIDAPRPILLYVGRVAVEKNIEAFLETPTVGTKVVVGDGPLRPALQQRHPDVRFLGEKHGDDLARHYASADVFVFPSRTDTFGLVMLEALASGVPVAAFPVPGPVDVIRDPAVGCLDDQLGRAIEGALDKSRSACRRFAEGHSWAASAGQFLGNLLPVRGTIA